ncbi:hypothetical protein KIK04_12425 [Paenibacillus sp. 481]|nr:hypothetical protein KIK04_12425 [Paenibacillus sp. 481]
MNKLNSEDSEALTNNKIRVLIGSPVHQRPEILQEFLTSLANLQADDVEIHYFFIDDNIISESSDLLRRFAQRNKVYHMPSYYADEYKCDADKHHWKEELIWKVAHFKNDIIQFSITNNYDYLFLIDSDLVLNPATLLQLIKAQKDIVSNIFWTQWSEADSIELPQVWLKDFYTLYESTRIEKLDKESVISRTNQFISMLRIPGTYRVGGLGACTLISKDALLKGVNFSEIKNLSIRGEDRHFCIRAEALGIELFVDTHFPAFHIYRETDLLTAKQLNSHHTMC